MLFFITLILPGILSLYGLAIIVLTGTLFRKAGVRGPVYGGNGSGGGLPGVSVVIPFRNEESNLRALLESLENQSYKGAAEVILVNDQSDDNGVVIINKYCQHNGNISIKIINLQLSNDVRLTSKQQALDLGIAESSHPLIALTDADMILAPEWIESLVNSHLSTGSDLVFGHTSVINKNSRLFTVFESYQLEFLFAFAYAISKLNLITGSCMGNNILVTKESYVKCGGQRGIGYSIVEDRALLETMRKKGFRTAAAEPFSPTAKTYPSRSKKQFMSQMTRWAAGGLRPGGGLFAAGCLLTVQNFCFLISAVGAGILPGMIMALSALNFLLTWAFLTISFRKNRSPAPKLFYPLYYVFMMIETAIFGFLLVFRPKIHWKNRKL
ncbi:MAG: glycosyltransferase [Chitinispirillales bacterium]|jgi:cellulose synthase/poly-beta-1,6-N-acetylglucosamine synthase-like glycosyltransferase|nr:glycosyltransferase [Chitinispirillales bacterium]